MLKLTSSLDAAPSCSNNHLGREKDASNHVFWLQTTYLGGGGNEYRTSGVPTKLIIASVEEFVCDLIEWCFLSRGTDLGHPHLQLKLQFPTATFHPGRISCLEIRVQRRLIYRRFE